MNMVSIKHAASRAANGGNVIFFIHVIMKDIGFSTIGYQDIIEHDVYDTERFK